MWIPYRDDTSFPVARLPSNVTDFVTHESLETITGRVARVGGTRRRQVVAPNLEPPDDDVVRVDLDGSTYRAPVDVTGDGELAFRGAFDSPTQARNRTGTDQLPAFLDDHDLDTGRTIHVDVVEIGFRYGLRAPGQQATYRATGQPPSSLADIARNLDE